MKSAVITIFSLLLGLLLVSSIAFAQKDEEGCKDHPMFTRMQNFYISDCRESKFDQVDFRDERGKEIKVEGRHLYTEYSIKKGLFLRANYRLSETLKML